MLSLLLLLTGLQQQPAPDVMSGVDRDRLTVGEEMLFTVRVTSASTDPVQVIVPPLAGLEVIARSERTEVSYGGGPARVTVLEMRLRALQPGKWRLGPIQVRQGHHVVQGDAVEIAITGAGGGVAAGLSPRVQRMLEHAPTPERNRASLTVALSADTALVGEQVDVLTAAWFPRDLRIQLRRPPTLYAPQIDGVWSYPQRVPVGIAASRLVGGVWYDAFVLHQIIFPLSAGPVQIGPGTVHYSVPLAFQFFSQEERYTLMSTGTTLRVDGLPDGGRPPGFSGAVGHQLTLDRSIAPPAGHVGESYTVDITLQGEGNVALWPSPEVRWPAGVRAYSDRVDERIEPGLTGRLGGSKTFRFLVVPDSTGAQLLPSINYSYFDPVTRAFALTYVGASSIAVAPSADAAPSKALPPPLMYGHRAPLAWSLIHGIPRPVEWVVLLLPPLFFAGTTLKRRPRRVAIAPGRTDDLGSTERRLAAVIRDLAPGAAAESGERLVQALRASGLDAATAAEAARLRAKLQQARFGPVGREKVERLVAEVLALMPRFTEERRRRRRPSRSPLTLALCLLPLVRSGTQAPSPEQLYEAGALRDAAAGFERRVAESPASPVDWYNFGAAQFRLGHDGRALAAWTAARRLAPRERGIRLALRLVPPPELASARRLWASPVTPEELLLVAGLSWIVGWMGLALRRAAAGRWVTVLGAAIGLGGAAGALAFWYQRPVAVVASEGTSRLLLSPHQRAPQVGVLVEGSAVLLRRQMGGWRLVEGPDGHEGWMAADQLAQLRVNGEP